MRTDDEVYNRIIHMATREREVDLFHYRILILLSYYKVNHAIPVLTNLDLFVARTGIDAEKVDPMEGYSTEYLHEYAVESIEVGWDCAESHQMVELLRCIHEAVEVAWLLGHDEDALEEVLQSGVAAVSGTTALLKLSHLFGVRPPASEKIRNMMVGLPCTDGCLRCTPRMSRQVFVRREATADAWTPVNEWQPVSGEFLVTYHPYAEKKLVVSAVYDESWGCWTPIGHPYRWAPSTIVGVRLLPPPMEAE